MTSHSNNSPERLHALDGLRAMMMLLGLVLHALCSYTITELGEAWPYKDPVNTFAADALVAFIHQFRMPIFFILAGFFAALLYLRRGPLDMLKNRWRRIVIPFVLFLLLISPLVSTGFGFANVSKTQGFSSAAESVLPSFAQFDLYLPTNTMHLWFIYYLILFYLVGVLTAWLVKQLPAAFALGVKTTFSAMLSHPVWRLAIPVLLTTLLLILMDGMLATSTAFIPNPVLLMTYFSFFAFGWLLYGERQRLGNLSDSPWIQIGVATVLFSVVGLFAESEQSEALGSTRTLLRAVMGASVAWLMFYGTMGLFLCHLQYPSALLRWVVDASYWVYLVHLPVAIWIPALLVHADLSAIARIMITLLGTIAVSFSTYGLFVRSSWIGVLLNGRRQPRTYSEAR